MNLDHKDRQLLALLEQDSRLTNAELAEKLGMSTSACWRRVRAFEEAGIIEQRRPGLGVWCIKRGTLEYDSGTDSLVGSWSAPGCAPGRIYLQRVNSTHRPP